MSARAYRVAPRRAVRGRPRSRIRWDKVGRVVLVLVIFLVLLSYVRPSLSFFDAWRQSKASRTELVELKREKSRLAAKVASLSNRTAVAESARRLGMIAPGERAFVVKR